MNYYSFKFKILSIFILPIIAVLYFALNSLNTDYTKLKDAYQIQNTSNLTKVLTTLIYNIQLERGLSAGYIIAKDKQKYKQALLKQFEKTDKVQIEFKTKLTSEKYKLLYIKLNNKSKSSLFNIIKSLKNKNKIRESVLNSTINFKDEIEYYTQINKQIIFNIRVINSINTTFNIDTAALISLENIKEYVGLQRAYIHNQLLGGINQVSMNRLELLNIKEQNSKNQFLIYSSDKSIDIYNSALNKKLIRDLKFCKDGIRDGSLNADNASSCFRTSTDYIDSLVNISKKIISNYLSSSKIIENKAKSSLYITSSIWLISIIALFLLMYILKKLLITEEVHIKKLTIASYAFNSQEAMIITDKNAIILEVNKAFTDITGYTEKEVIGKSPNILKSDEHDNYFFEKMWYDIMTIGKWNGEIYNKRKNNKIYPERLSITAIHDTNNNIINYIAQFLDLSDIKKAQKIAEHESTHDFLTGVLNRKALTQRLYEEFQRANRHNFKHAFLFIDLDNFKAVNDEHGHLIGDKLIIETASRLKSSIRESDILARLSGDEFAIILLNLENDKIERIKDIETICNKILKSISKEYNFEKIAINISSSIGIKQFPSFEKSIEDIVSNADMAMYEAKENGKNQFRIFDIENKN